MNCPKCKDQKLKKVVEKEIELDFCEQCHGIWFDRKELEKMMDKAVELSFDDIKSDKTMIDLDLQKADCPICDVPLEKIPKRNVDHLTIDQCYRCKGIWLDGGEFYRISKEHLLSKIKNTLF